MGCRRGRYFIKKYIISTEKILKIKDIFHGKDIKYNNNGKYTKDIIKGKNIKYMIVGRYIKDIIKGKM